MQPYKRKMKNLTVISFKEPQEKLHGYKHVIRSMGMPYTAYKTDKGFEKWKERTNLILTELSRFTTDDGHENIMYRVTGDLIEVSFWSMDDVPKEAKSYLGLSNGCYVTCFYIHTDNGCELYKPNPNAKEVYKPLAYKDHKRQIAEYE